MKLSDEEIDLFFEVMWPLQHYACGKLDVVPEVDSLEEIMALGFDEKLLVREALFDNPQVIDEFIAENPSGLGEEQLSIARGWRDFVKGEFYIERYLRKYAIFVHADEVYAVLGLRSSFEEMFPRSYLPRYVEAILLPFRDKIVYDGYLKPYNVFFGGSMKADLKEIYMKAKQNGKIIFSLGAGARTAPAGREVIQSVDWSGELRQLMAISRTLKGGAGQPVINTAVFGLVRASIDLADSAISDRPDKNRLFEELDRAGKALKRVESILHRME